MKNQYFADKRDYVKYDLLLELLSYESENRLRQPRFLQWISILMLTESDQTKEGSKKQFEVGTRRLELHSFLSQFIKQRSFYVSHLNGLAQHLQANYVYHPYLDTSNFRHEQRDTYFKSIPRPYFEHSLIFCDPDIGIETGTKSYMNKMGPEKYLMWGELKDLAERAGEGCGFVIYQHLQKNSAAHIGDMEAKATKLAEICDFSSVGAVYDGDIALLVGSQSGPVHAGMISILEEYVPQHPDLELHVFVK